MKLFRRGLIKLALPLSCGLGLVAALFAQRPFHQYPSVEYGESIPLPSDWQRPGEWAFARLMYPPGPNDGYRGRFDGDWRQGMSLWTQDGPPADRAMAAAVRRLTRIDARSVEQDVNLDDGDEDYNWPWLYAVQVGSPPPPPSATAHPSPRRPAGTASLPGLFPGARDRRRTDRCGDAARGPPPIESGPSRAGRRRPPAAGRGVIRAGGRCRSIFDPQGCGPGREETGSRQACRCSFRCGEPCGRQRARRRPGCTAACTPRPDPIQV